MLISLLSGRYRWFVCVLLFLATTINYIDRQILSLLKPILDDQLHWTNEQFGQVNAAFQLAYAVGLLGFGWFIDKYGTRIGYAVSIGAWSLAAAGHALVMSIGGFFIARVALGLGEAGNFPAAVKAVSLWFPKRERALATSLFNSGSNVGAIIAPTIVPFIAFTWGWHAAFLLAGLAGLIWIAFWLPFYNTPEKVPAVTPGELEHIRSDAEVSDDGQARPSWLDLLRVRQTWGFILAKFLTDPVWWFFLIWLPDYFKQTRHLDLKNSWVHLVTIYTIVTVLSVAGGWVTGHLAKSGWSVTKARKTGMFIFALCVVPILFARSVGDWTAVLLIGLAGAAHQAWSANLFTTVSDVFPRRAVASVVGLGGMAGSVGGIMFPIISGRLLDRFSADGDVAGGYAVLFGFCAFAYLVAFALNHVCTPRFERVELPARTAG